MSFHSMFLSHVGVRFNKLLSKAESGKMRSSGVQCREWRSNGVNFKGLRRSAVYYRGAKSSDAPGAMIYVNKLRNDKNCEFGTSSQGRFTANNIQ